MPKRKRWGSFRETFKTALVYIYYVFANERFRNTLTILRKLKKTLKAHFKNDKHVYHAESSLVQHQHIFSRASMFLRRLPVNKSHGIAAWRAQQLSTACKVCIEQSGFQRAQIRFK